MIEKVGQIIREDCRRTIDEVSMLVGPDKWWNNTRLLQHDNAPAHAALLNRRFLTDNNILPTRPTLHPATFSYFQN